MSDPQAERNFLELKNKSYEIKFDLNETNYKSLENIGTGAYGVVCSALHTVTDEKVAIKKIPDIFEQPTIAKRTYREIKILKHLKHDNIIAIREILKPKGAVENLTDVYIVLDLMETDLHRIIHSKQELTDEHVRYFLYQILRGLKYIHSANIIHRDLKPSNLLVNENCDLKIGDFGMARAVASNPEEYNVLMTQYVATRWYRAPELMMARLAYTGAVDMWSVGCIFAEMLGRKQIFPGRDYIHQLRLIIGVLGTPPKEFIKLTQSDTIKNFIKGWGSKKPVALSTMYPKAKPGALSLLNQMLQINPQTRASVLNALSHPFLNKYHDPLDEPICVPAFDFAFEKKGASSGAIKEAIISEIMEYHKVVEKPKILFDFRPVPKELIQPKPAKNLPDSSSRPLGSAEGDGGNFGLNAFLTKIRDPPMMKNSNCSSIEKATTGLSAFLHQSPYNKDNSNKSNQLPAFLSTNSPTGNETDFKVPLGLPISKMKNLKVKAEDGGGQSDVEMLSAKSEQGLASGQLSVSTLAASKDVEMLSANKPKDEPPEEKPLNTKEVLKAAILSAALRKQKGELVSKPRPMTALQRQREREDKKRKKMEKAMERKKKQKQKQKKSASINLTDEDKSLLEKWAKMQNPKPTTKNQPPQNVPNTSNANQHFVQQTSITQQFDIVQPPLNVHAGQPSLNIPPMTHVIQTTSTISISSVNGPHAVQNPVNTINMQGSRSTLPPATEMSRPLNTMAFAQTANAGNVNVMGNEHQQQNYPSVQTNMGAQSTATFSPLDNPLDSLLDVLGENSNSMGSPSFSQIADSHVFGKDSHNIGSNSQINASGAHIFSTSSDVLRRDSHVAAVTSHNSGLDSHFPENSSHVFTPEVMANNSSMFTNTSTHIFATDSTKKLQHQSSNPSRMPPSYTEAITARLQGTMSPEHQPHTTLPFVTATSETHLVHSNADNNTPAIEKTADSSFLPFQSYQTSNIDYMSQIPSQTQPRVGGSDSEGNMLSVITRQMMKSHVDDLTLTQTPKGTGGGYGVGLDMEAVMSEAIKDLTSAERSAPLSATESLIGDWLEVSGMKGLDAKDYEALERELGLGSPINLNDIVTSPT